MKINIVDTKGDFKKTVEVPRFETLNTHTDVIQGFIRAEELIGKKIIANIRGLRWSIDEIVSFLKNGVLDKELNGVIDGKVVNFEVSDL